MSDFPIIENEGILLVDSRLVAERLGIEHESFMETIYAYQSQIEKEFGIFRFQTGKIDGRGRPAKYALLTEDQSQVLMTFFRNTPQVIQCKIDLVKAFSKAKDLLHLLEKLLVQLKLCRDWVSAKIFKKSSPSQLNFLMV